jgi:ankyrin repeat protein
MTHIDLCGQTPLHCVAANGNSKSLNVLLASGADPLARDDDGWLPIECAVQRGSLECVRLLLPSLVSLSINIESSASACSSASNESSVNVSGRRAICCGDVHATGVDAVDDSNYVERLVYRACAHGRLEVLHELVRVAADNKIAVDLHAPVGFARRTPARAAVAKGHLHVLQALVCDYGYELERCNVKLKSLERPAAALDPLECWGRTTTT